MSKTKSFIETEKKTIEPYNLIYSNIIHNSRLFEGQNQPFADVL